MQCPSYATSDAVFYTKSDFLNACIKMSNGNSKFIYKTIVVGAALFYLTLEF